MHFEGSQKLNFEHQLIWSLLNDPDVLARATPGVKEMKLVKPDHFDTTFHIKLGPLNATFKGSLRVVKKVAPKHFTLLVDVDARIGIINAEVVISLASEQDVTHVSFVGDGKLSGKLAQMGSRLLMPVARMFTKSFFKQLTKEAEHMKGATGPTTREEAV